MKKLLLPPTRKNEVLRMIKNRGLDPREFEWTEIEVDHIPTVADAAIVSELVHRPTGYSCHFDLRANLNTVTYSPGGDVVERDEQRSNIEKLVACIPRWLDYLTPEIQAPDLWAEFVQAMPSFETELTIADDRGFSPNEQASAHQAVSEMREWSHRQQLTDDKLERIEAHLDYLDKAVDRLSKQDWLNVGWATLLRITSILLRGENAQEVIQEFMQTARDALARLGDRIAGFLP